MRFFASYLGEAEGRLEVVEMDIDKTPMHMLPTGVDIVECVNFSHSYDERELAQTLMAFGKPEARYFVSLLGGPAGVNDKLTQALLKASAGRGAITNIGIFASDAYNPPHNRANIVRIY